MISFRIINEDNKEEILTELSSELPKEEAETIREIIFSFGILEDGDIEFAICLFSGCVLIRIFDYGRYLFAFPYAISEAADMRAAIAAVREYAMREEIPLIFTDVPSESLPLLSGFRHMDIDAEDENGECYRVKIKRESDLIDELPSIEYGRVKLNALCEADIADYASLCKDKNVNKYWGYDYSEDVCEPSDRYFYENAQLELASGASISLAIRYEDKFVGEAVIYAFDGRGGAEFAIRLMPDFQGKGLGTETVRALCEVGRRIGLIRLNSKIMKENTASVRMLKKVSNEFAGDSDFVTFTIYLN